MRPVEPTRRSQVANGKGVGPRKHGFEGARGRGASMKPRVDKSSSAGVAQGTPVSANATTGLINSGQTAAPAAHGVRRSGHGPRRG